MKKGLWVVRNILEEPKSIREMTDIAIKHNFEELFVQVRGRGEAFYKSEIDPLDPAIKDKDFDPLAYLIELLAGQPIKVHAWINTLFTWSGDQEPWSDRHVIRRHPEWVMYDYHGVSLNDYTQQQLTESGIYEGQYLCPAKRGVQEYLLAIYSEAVQQYKVNGIHFDFVRYPNPEVCYCPECRLQAKKDLGFDPLKVDQFSPEQQSAWNKWRQQRVTALVRGVYQALKGIDRNMGVSAAVYPDFDDASTWRLQDWPEWDREEIIDLLVPMAYTDDHQELTSWLESYCKKDWKSQFMIGLGAYKVDSDQLVEQLKISRNLGYDGHVIFDYGTLLRDKDYFSKINEIE